MLSELLSKLPKKELDKVLLKYEVDSIDEAIPKIYIKFSNHTLCLTDKDLEALSKLSKREKVNDIPKFLLDNYFVVKIKGEYYLPDEFNPIMDLINSKKIKKQRIYAIICFYLKMNGIMPIKDLKEILGQSGVKTTIKEIKSCLDENDIEYDDGIIFYDEPLSYIVGNIGIYSEFKVFDIHYVYYIYNLIHEYYIPKITDVILNKVEKKFHGDSLNFIETIFTIIYAFCELEDVKKYISNELKGLKLSKEETKKTFDIIEEAHNILPNWQYGGYSPMEFESLVDEKEYYENIEKIVKENISIDNEWMPNVENNLVGYIELYLHINGIIEIDKLIEILRDNHNINTTKEEVIALSEFIDLSTDGNVLSVLNNVHELMPLLALKKLIKKYKVITGDIEDELVNYASQLNELNSILLDYMNDKSAKVIVNLLMYSPIDKKIIKSSLESENIKLNNKDFDNMYEKVKNIASDMRVWSLNGFTLNEINSGKII